MFSQMPSTCNPTTAIHDHNNKAPPTLITTTGIAHLDNRLASFRIVGIRGELSIEQADSLFTLTRGRVEISEIIIRRVRCDNAPREESRMCVLGRTSGWFTSFYTPSRNKGRQPKVPKDGRTWINWSLRIHRPAKLLKAS